METITVRELKSQWAEIERRTREGESFLILNRGRPAARLLPVSPRAVLHWDDHLETAADGIGLKSQEIVRADREGRW
jgi:prevent-host-death family protein